MGHRFLAWSRRVVLAVGVVGLCAALALAGSEFWIMGSAGPYVFPGIHDVPSRDIAIVPGVGWARAMRPPSCLLARLRAALAVYRAHKVEAILVSGVGDAGSPTDEIAEMQRWLKERGVSSEHILVDPSGLRTLDTMKRAVEFLHVRSAIVCTQVPFVNRTIFLARGVGIDAVGLIAPSAAFPTSAWRTESLKAIRAVADIHFLHTRARVADARGVVDGRSLVAER